MRGSTYRRAIGAVLVLVAGVVGGIEPARADVPPPDRVVSNYETATGLVLHRDAGVSVPLAPVPGQPAGENRSLWIFGDTAQTDAEGNPVPPLLPFWPGTWGAIGPYTPGQVPTALSHVPTPGNPMTIPNANGPSLLVDHPVGLEVPDGSPCSGGDALYATAWTIGATRGPQGPLTLSDGGTPVSVVDASQLVLLSVFDVCVYSSPTPSPCDDSETASAWAPVRWTVQRLRLVAYRPADNAIVSTSTPFQTSDGSCLPWQQKLTTPVFAGGHLYLYASHCDSVAPAFGACLAGQVTAARVPAAQLHDPAAYEWAAAGGGWTASHEDAATVLPAGGQLGPMAQDVHHFASVGRGYLLLAHTSFGGHYNLYEATTPAGPWVLRQSAVMPGCISGDGEGCYALVGHPELSTAGHLLYSRVDMSEGLVEVVDIGAVP